MFEHFTDRARKVMALANQEAQRHNHEYVGTEHILLGLIKEGSGVGAKVIESYVSDNHKVRFEIEKLIKSGPDMVTMGKLPQTPRAKKVIEYAIEESGLLGQSYIGTEHLLLGLLREHDGIACQVLTSMGLELQSVRSAVGDIIGGLKPKESFPKCDCKLADRVASIDGDIKELLVHLAKQEKFHELDEVIDIIYRLRRIHDSLKAADST